MIHASFYIYCDYPIRNQLYSPELKALDKDDQKGLHRAAQIRRVTSSISGFGFNQTTNKYKVIKAVYRTPLHGPRNCHSRLLSFQAEVQILTLGRLEFS
ncbi:hypothetical protein QYF36_008455 [Acer negundo]|nr:hypothetical protein QYF36_008455 [Acer negundo]